MTTFTDLLPPTKTHANRAVKYTPACRGVGTLELTDSRTHTRYLLARQPFGGVRLTKADGSETYVVTAGQCECAGFVFGRGKLCKHLEALHCLTGNGWLDAVGDELESVGDKHDAADEMDAYYAGGDWDNSPDRLGDDEYAAALGGAVFADEPLPC